MVVIPKSSISGFLGASRHVAGPLRVGAQPPRRTASVFDAAILGGIGSAPGALAGALIVGIVEEVGTLVIPPTYKTAIGFVIILILTGVRLAAVQQILVGVVLVVLMIRRPEGLLPETPGSD